MCGARVWRTSRLRGTDSLLLPSMHARARAPFFANPTLTDARNFMYYCLPNHRSALAKGVGGDPPFQGDPGLKLE